jgi:thiosulfate dehydrogenase
MNRPASLGAVLLSFALAGCGDREVPAAQFGAKLFEDPRLSTSPFNLFSCATCHAVNPAAPAVVRERFDPGYNLGNAVGRPAWWGGEETTVLDAINVCFSQFMGGRPWQAADEQARLLYAFLDENSPAPTSPAAPFTVVRDVSPLDTIKGDGSKGALVWVGACQRCHGSIHSGAGRLGSEVSIVPDDTQKMFGDLARAVVVEKIRHGRFFNIGGVMPLFSVETMSDAQVADTLAYLGL